MSPDQIESQLSAEHRDAMLDIILTWASIDGALSILLADFMNMPLVDAAKTIRKKNGSTKLAEMIRALQTSEGGSLHVSKFRKLKKKYEQYSKLRDFVAHSRCVGHWTKSPNHLVFLTVEKVGDDKLAVEAISVGSFQEATAWGEGFLKLVLEMSSNPDS